MKPGDLYVVKHKHDTDLVPVWASHDVTDSDVLVRLAPGCLLIIVQVGMGGRASS